MDVPITDLRANLRDWIEQARAGNAVVVTERGVPVARLTAIDSASLIERLEQDGLMTRPERAQRPSARSHRRVSAKGSVSDLVSELRR